MYEERYDEAVDIYAFGMCMLEMATSEYPYNECSVPAQIYKKVVSGVKPASYEKVTNDKVKQIISQCIQLNKDDRPGCKDLLNSDFFSDDIGIKLQPLSKEVFLNNPDCNKIEFRLRLLDSKQRMYKHKEDEAIQFDFAIGIDNTDDIASDMFNANIISEDDSKIVSKLLKVQISAMLKERREKAAQQQLNLVNAVREQVSDDEDKKSDDSGSSGHFLAVPNVPIQHEVSNNNESFPTTLTVPQLLCPPQSPPQTSSSRPASIGHVSVFFSPTTIFSFVFLVIIFFLLISTQSSEQSITPSSKSKRSSKTSTDRSLPKLSLISVDADGKMVECSMENLLKTITFKFDINDVNLTEVTNDLVSYIFDVNQSQDLSFMEFDFSFLRFQKNYWPKIKELFSPNW